MYVEWQRNKYKLKRQASWLSLCRIVAVVWEKQIEQIRKNCWQEMGIKHLTMQFSHTDARTSVSVLRSSNGRRNKPTRELTELEWSWIARESKPLDTNWIYDDSCGLRASLQLAYHRVRRVPIYKTHAAAHCTPLTVQSASTTTKSTAT